MPLKWREENELALESLRSAKIEKIAGYFLNGFVITTIKNAINLIFASILIEYISIIFGKWQLLAAPMTLKHYF